MQKKRVISEIYLTTKTVSKDKWLSFIQTVSKYIGYCKSFTIYVKIDLNQLEYYIETPYDLPITFDSIDELVLKKTNKEIFFDGRSSFFYLNHHLLNIVSIIDDEEIKHHQKVLGLCIKIFCLNQNKRYYKNYLYVKTNNKIKKKRIPFCNPQYLLSIDFEKNPRFFYHKAPKYLNIQKILHLLRSDSTNAIFKIDTFPYLQGNYYLNQSSYSFDKHSLIVGASGSGKSKLISLLVHNIASNLDYQLKYKIVIIDPHSALENDIGGLDRTAIINFKTLEESIDLFMNTSDDILSSSELILSLLKSLIKDQYNAKIERVLRHSLHLLLTCRHFTFQNLRKLLLDTEYRSLLLKELEGYVHESVINFFLVDFNEMRTRSYSEVIAPIISFIDEVQLLPVFSQNEPLNQTVLDVIQNQFLTIFSLDRLYLGDKITKTVSGLIMQQIMQIIQARKIKEHILLVIDEVSILENPILIHFLSEARKFGLSVVLAQQYFDQISHELKNAIFANVMNYYVFRVSQLDASLLVDSLTMKLEKGDTKEERAKILLNLNERECIVRISSGGLLLPAFKAKTVDFVAIPKVMRKLEPVYHHTEHILTTFHPKFEINNTVSLMEVLLNQSSSRLDMRGEKND